MQLLLYKIKDKIKINNKIWKVIVIINRKWIDINKVLLMMSIVHILKDIIFKKGN